MSDKDIPHKLHTWLTQEMHFAPPPGTNLPSPDEIKGICRGSTVDVWKFILSRVHSVQTVKKVKGNLALRDQRHLKNSSDSRTSHSDEQEALAERRVQLTREVTQCLSDISHIEKDLKRLERETIQTERNYRSGCEDLRNKQRRTGLLHVYSKHKKENVAEYQEFKHRLEARVQSLVNKSSESRVFLAGGSNGGDSGLEAVSCRQVRETCGNIGAFLHETLKGSFAGDKRAFNEKKQGLWTQVETTLSDLTVGQLVSSLVTNTNLSALALREKTLAINIKQDAEKLRFKFEKVGQLKDMSSSQPLLMSVHQLLEESQLSHLHDYMMTEKSLNQTFKLQQEYSNLQDKLRKLLTRTFTDRAGELQLAQKVIDGELEVMRARATLYSLLDVKDRLQENMESSQKARQKMHLAYKKIHDFQQIADSKQNLIRVLSKQNLNAQSRLTAQQAEIQQYIQKSLSTHLADTRALTNQLEGGVASEIDRFSVLSLPYLLHVYLDGATKVGLLNLSVHQTNHPSVASVRPALHKTLDAIHFPSYKAPECVLPWCMEVMQEMKLSEQITQSLDQADRKSRHNHDNVLEDIAELRSAVTEQDRKQVERLLPVLNKRLALAGDGLGDALQAHAALQDWWDQPAQSCVPWAKVDNHTYKDWQDRWKVMVTRLVQLQVQR
ncbi:AUGMIN subunit 5-like isoform X2 [Haliotis rufescens]|uniref:AUGMIN subunit 5-like isoform X2 n=1 Tax=Haliotis rufescens TaxID=6454 RepID=UPI00201F5B1E|nr:AUGMIN subunit 5-like isoform X2 [Haliotis rufescens]